MSGSPEDHGGGRADQEERDRERDDDPDVEATLRGRWDGGGEEGLGIAGGRRSVRRLGAACRGWDGVHAIRAGEPISLGGEGFDEPLDLLEALLGVARHRAFDDLDERVREARVEREEGGRLA
jgi:hypothetical protein